MYLYRLLLKLSRFYSNNECFILESEHNPTSCKPRGADKLFHSLTDCGIKHVDGHNAAGFYPVLPGMICCDSTFGGVP